MSPSSHPLAHAHLLLQDANSSFDHVRYAILCAFGSSWLGLTTPLPQDNLIFVVGKLDGLMVVGMRRHNADDVVATALAVEPMKFVYRGR